jgi:L-asparaginase
VIDLMAVDSASMTLAMMQRVIDQVSSTLDDSRIAGVVVLHGTDSLEETALLAHLQIGASGKPVVFTGAQYTADDVRTDGPRNLHDALSFARRGDASLHQNGGGSSVVISFGGRLLPAWALLKASTQSADAFRVAVATSAGSAAALGRYRRAHDGVGAINVRVIAISPGDDGALVRASLDLGVDGVVLEALGGGNASEQVVSAVRDGVEAGIPVVVTSRVPIGALAPSYGGGGGGHDLVAAGAIFSRSLRAGQSRILLAEMLARRSSQSQTRAAFAV